MLAIYKNDGSMILITGGTMTDGVNAIECEIPEGKYLKEIDTSVTPHQPVFEDIPKSDMELLKERVSNLEQKNEAIETGIEAALGGK